VLDHHGLIGSYPGLETATRVTPSGQRLLFLLNHGSHPVPAVAHAAGVDLLTGQRIEAGSALKLDPQGVMVLHLDLVH